MSTIAGISVEAFLEGDFPPDAQLVDGEVVVDDPTFWHQELCARIGEALRAWTRSAPGRGCAGYGGNWVLGEGQVYKPDVWWRAVQDLPGGGGVRSDLPPDLAIEVRSPGTWSVDVGRKQTVYEQQGVRELWLVDHPVRTVLVRRRARPGAPHFGVSFDAGPEMAPLTSPLLPGFGLDLADLFDRS